MNTNNVSCSLVIRCCNEEEHIGRLLCGVMEQTIKDVEIIIVDSGSTDATLSIASRYPVRIISISPEEFSFGRALNKGCVAANGEFIVIASAHVYPLYKDWFEHMLAPFESPEVALVYGKQRGTDVSWYSEHQIFKKWFPDGSINRQRHPFCNNANSAIRRSLWDTIPYNEELTGLEDLDWAKRVSELGKSIIYSADAEVIHVHNETLQKIYNRYRREASAFKHIYPFESFNFQSFLKLFVANTATDYYHAWLDGELLRNIVSIPSFRLMQFWGTFRGFQHNGFITPQLRNRFYYPNDFFRNKELDDEMEDERRIDYEHH